MCINRQDPPSKTALWAKIKSSTILVVYVLWDEITPSKLETFVSFVLPLALLPSHKPNTTGNGRFANNTKLLAKTPILLAKAFPTGLACSCWESTVGVLSEGKELFTNRNAGPVELRQQPRVLLAKGEHRQLGYRSLRQQDRNGCWRRLRQ
jgi:hypothetical protein